MNSLVHVRLRGDCTDVLECSICQGGLAKDEIITSLPVCGHIFHSECICEWVTSVDQKHQEQQRRQHHQHQEDQPPVVLTCPDCRQCIHNKDNTSNSKRYPTPTHVSQHPITDLVYMSQAVLRPVAGKV
jgi:hypothetical protein